MVHLVIKILIFVNNQGGIQTRRNIIGLKEYFKGNNNNPRVVNYLVTVHRWRNCKFDSADHVYRTLGVSYGCHRRQGFPQDFIMHMLVAHLKNKSFTRISCLATD